MLNYSAHAIEDLKKDYPRIPTHDDRQAFTTFFDDLRNAIKFELPDRGQIIYGIGNTPDDLEMGRLPFPVIALEFPYSPHERIDSNTLHAGKRLVVAKEVVVDIGTSVIRSAKSNEIPTHIRIDVAAYINSERRWILQPVSALVVVGEKSGPPEVSREEDPFREGRIFGGATFRFIATPRIPSVAMAMKLQGATFFQHAASNDLGAEICILAEFLAVLNCSNVTTDVQKVPEKLARARQKAGKEPFDDVHVLVLKGARLGGSEGQDDSRNSGYKVREHVRRGHIRRLGSGKTVWVNHALIAAGSKAGEARKIYRIKG